MPPTPTRPGSFTGVRRKPKAILCGVGEHIAKQFRSGLPLVSADAESDHARTLKPHAQLGHLLCLICAKLAHGIKNPEQRNAEVAFPAFPAAFQSSEDRLEILLPPQAHSDRDVHFGVQHILRFELFHQSIGDEFVVFGSLQLFSHRLERHQKSGEVLVTVKLLHLVRAWLFSRDASSTRAKWKDRSNPQDARCSSAFGEGDDKVAGQGAHTQIVDSKPQICEHSKGAHLISGLPIRIITLPFDLARGSRARGENRRRRRVREFAAESANAEELQSHGTKRFVTGQNSRTTLFCTAIWNRCVARVGKVLRRWTA